MVNTQLKHALGHFVDMKGFPGNKDDTGAAVYNIGLYEKYWIVAGPAKFLDASTVVLCTGKLIRRENAKDLFNFDITYNPYFKPVDAMLEPFITTDLINMLRAVSHELHGGRLDEGDIPNVIGLALHRLAKVYRPSYKKDDTSIVVTVDEEAILRSLSRGEA